MERFNYIIVTSDNKWESTGDNATEEELQQDILDVKERLADEGRIVTLYVHKGSFLFHTEM